MFMLNSNIADAVIFEIGYWKHCTLSLMTFSVGIHIINNFISSVTKIKMKYHSVLEGTSYDGSFSRECSI